MNGAKTTQLNVRLDGSLKQSGDAALASIGLNPSEAIRALWEKASRRGQDLEEIDRLLNKTSSPQSSQAKRKNPFLPGRQAVDEYLKSIGCVDAASIPPSSMTDKEMLEEALVERMLERGLM